MPDDTPTDIGAASGPIANASVIAREAVETARAEEAARKVALAGELIVREAAAVRAHEDTEEPPEAGIRDVADTIDLPESSVEPSSFTGS